MSTQATQHQHPSYVARIEDWQQMSDTLAGEAVVKAAGETYLPMTDGMLKLETTLRNAIYEAYKKRAVFLNFVEETGESILGMMDKKSAHIVLPEALAGYETQMTPDGYDVHTLLKYINREQVFKGRIGLLPDIKEGATSQDLPYISVYSAETIINWNAEFIDGEEVLTFVVLDQSGSALVDGSWETVQQYLVLLLVDGKYSQYTCQDEGQISQTPGEGVELSTPSIAGKTLDRIPFVLANCRDNSTDVSKPPLLEISNLSLHAYQQDADYRAALYFAGQPTMTATGVQKEEVENAVIGSHTLLYSTNKDAKFGYAETAGNALDASKQACDDLKMEANKRGVALMEQGVESGNALEQRSASKTANIKTIVSTGKSAMLRLLEFICIWKGVNFDECVVEPNTDFVQDNLTAADLSSLMSAKGLGAPISYESIHAWMKDRKYTDREWEDEKDLISQELIDFAPPEPTSPTLDEPEEEV